ncbi:cytochrome-450 hydroxylase [Dendrothele bispora CBS 962.96]|uniref:Cytochrome-450 hydroxylase n=1 Tax=Dendrothele bispora (strain CBS 962.96) TaxID=1314807 RepID=A0A4V4HIZ9_DENBC|nr:cytochrome-450 hydroxylase [Dendrothele bispora CBS 962.96]
MSLLQLFLGWLVLLVIVLVYYLLILPRLNPLGRLSGPPIRSFFVNHLQPVLDPARSPIVYDHLVKHYGRSIRIRGVGPWDDRLLTLDPVSLSHVLKNTAIYEKPWQSRRLITSLIGCGMLSAEGQMHKRQRRVATPAFSVQNLRALIPLVFQKGNELKDRWKDIIQKEENSGPHVLDICHWVSRATFDVIGLAGFDYNFNAIQDESNELFLAYKDMFEIAISQGNLFRTLLSIYSPTLNQLFPDKAVKTVRRCQAVIRRVAGNLIQEKKYKIEEGERSGHAYTGRDLLTLLLKSNTAVDLPPEQRIDDDDILNNINTFMFAGSDTSSLTVTWTLHLLARHPELQSRLRSELSSVTTSSSPKISDLTDEEMRTMFSDIDALPFLHNVIRESLRLIPPVHSSLRVATKDDDVPTMYPVQWINGSTSNTVHVPKGSFVHVSIEAFNLDKDVWGQDAWDFCPDRWDNLSEKVSEQPGLFSNLLTFSAGPRSCIGLRFSMIEIKTFLFFLITNFVFEETGDKIIKANVVLTRPYVSGKYSAGSRLPLKVIPYVPS